MDNSNKFKNPSNTYQSWKTKRDQEKTFTERYSPNIPDPYWASPPPVKSPVKSQQKTPIKKKNPPPLETQEIELPACMWCGEEFPSESIRDEHEDHCAD